MIIDMHTHILPAMDDGSPDIKCSLEMLQTEAEQNVERVCATSHYYAWQNSIEEFCARREKCSRNLAANWIADLPQIILAAEVAYFSDICACTELDRLCISGTRTLMLEMPFTEWTSMHVEAVQTLALDLGYQVVLVHPERYCHGRNNREKLEKLCLLPIGLQVNAYALAEFRSRKLALELLQMAQIPLLGSDCHNTNSRPPNIQAGRRIIQRKLGAKFLAGMDAAAEELTGASVDAK